MKVVVTLRRWEAPKLGRKSGRLRGRGKNCLELVLVLTEAGTITAVQIGIEAAKSTGAPGNAWPWYCIGATDGASEGSFRFTTDADLADTVTVTCDRLSRNMSAARNGLSSDRPYLDLGLKYG